MYQSDAEAPTTRRFVLLAACASLLSVITPEEANADRGRGGSRSSRSRSHARSKHRSGSHRSYLWGPIGMSYDAAPRCLMRRRMLLPSGHWSWRPVRVC